MLKGTVMVTESVKVATDVVRPFEDIL